MASGTHTVFKVFYPDKRRGPQGVSSALFRVRVNAETFAARNQGKVTALRVPHDELLRLNADQMFEFDHTAQTPRRRKHGSR